MDDALLRQAVIEELDYQPNIQAPTVGVAVAEGVVTIMGHVGSYAEKTAIEDAVRRIGGVRGIVQELEVSDPGGPRSLDEEIARRAVAVLSWQAMIPSDQIQVTVENGSLTLSGEVDWFYQRQEAEAAVRGLSGIVDVVNEIRSRPQAQPTDIKRRIEEALKRSAQVDAASIIVSVTNDTVTLRGTVKGDFERLLAEKAAFAAPGVRVVEDQLQLA